MKVVLQVIDLALSGRVSHMCVMVNYPLNVVEPVFVPAYGRARLRPSPPQAGTVLWKAQFSSSLTSL